MPVLTLPSGWISVRSAIRCVIVILLVPVASPAQHSAARLWNDALLDAIRVDFARPTVHARNLFHTSLGMYDAWAAYDDVASTFLLGKEVGGFHTPFAGVPRPADVRAAREEAISYAMYRLLSHRFGDSPGAEVALPRFDALFTALGYDATFTSTEYTSGSPAAFGNYIAQSLIAFGLQDGSNEQNGYANLFYESLNPPLFPALRGNPDLVDPNRWQPLVLKTFIDQTNIVYEGQQPDFLSPEWGLVTPFALSSDDLSIYERDGQEYRVYHDPGPPVYAEVDGDGLLEEEYRWGNTLVALWSAHLDPTDGVMIDISPATFGNLSIDEFPRSAEGLRDFYNMLEGGDPSSGRDLNPHTGEPYTAQIVPRGDYTRVLAEFWADGPDSETPPGHWFTILNYVNDHPLFEKRFRGVGPIVDDLEWDVKAYFLMAGAVHDAAISAWGIKGWYDYIRPISAFRWMADQGQSSDPNRRSYSPNGLPLIPGRIELVEPGDPLAEVAGDPDFNVGKIKLYCWRGPDFINDPETDVAGGSWIFARNWWPYQRPTFVTPPFAGYVSGHSTFSRAAAEVMTMLTGDEFFPGGLGEFHAPQNEFLVFEEGPSVDVTLQWATYRDASDQTSLSRIWGGIHPPIDDIPGRLIGAEIGVDAFAFAERYFEGLVPTVVEETSDAAIPDAFALSQNHPNPFNSQTLIRFALAQPGEVELLVYNLGGQRVALLSQGSRVAGTYEIRWDGRDADGRELASGVYLYQLKAGDNSQQRKLLLLR